MSRKAIFFILFVVGLSSMASAQSRLVPTGRLVTPYHEDVMDDYAIK